MPAPTLIELTEQERTQYHRLCRSGKTSVRLKERLLVVLLADEGLTNTEIAELVPMNAHSVAHKHVTLHFIPTGSSGLNLVERFFGLITDKAIRRSVFSSVEDLEEKLMQFIARYNENPKPFVWTKSVEVILEKVAPAKAALI